ncbi:NADPH-dependent 7-cyano-7-deazaguanine reductase [Zhongshania aliphaticivorans]|uniref:NADPH-dependent 7-cyano-7-deazaguanine reductase n=1 Tax=Zhongshania aliphaticivorans TaxID=1470434 RepID=A0A5S9NI67_9GAMM|nr:NADPH-dependent 7-cyano-7-deazaguanine reductase QueF [Zhongshania aliphaticivorans]CAA0089467.1 NADPH-dependent 7-cyano-7-deazaguanine reductase [Zhongshania aliphaticivorans]CAA0096267.1 NADPH-dependent 7-cyano-7-deazaguanine reductase [Zhongshania aliphaticivorans]
MDTDLGHGPLGEKTEYPSQYAPSCLHPISRQQGRELLKISGKKTPTFVGVDIWNAYELSWLTPEGKPCVACAEFRFPADSPNIVESKSFKLYLNSLNQTRIADVETLKDLLVTDLTRAAGARVHVSVVLPSEWPDVYGITTPKGVCLDDLSINPSEYRPSPELLALDGDDVCEERLYSHLLRSRCPVTSQPDWATVEINYRGPKINRQQLLAYIVSFREHDEFHEHCVERMFSDISRCCRPDRLSVYARYTRRGGLDINPWRSSSDAAAPLNSRGARQ